MQDSHVRPTGRRKTTAAMIAARAAQPGSWETVKRGVMLSAVKRASSTLGIPKRVIELVDFLLSLTQDMDWTDGLPIAWPSNATLQDVLQLGATQIKTVIRIALEFGLIEMRDSANGRRYGRRKQGHIVEAYGFDLSPLAARCVEFQAIAAAHAERRREAAALRGQIGSMRNRVLCLTDAGQEQCLESADWMALDAQAREIASRRKGLEDPERLGLLLKQLHDLHGLVQASLTQDQAVNTDPLGSENRPHLTSTKSPSLAKATTAVEGAKPPAYEAESSRSRSNPPKSAQVEPKKLDQREEARPSALRGFIVTPDFILKIAAGFRGWVRSTHPSWSELDEAGWLVRSDLGISQHAWGQACVILGRMEAVTALAVISARHGAGKVRSPGGLLRRMVELHQSGELHLDRTLFGLADECGARRH